MLEYFYQVPRTLDRFRKNPLGAFLNPLAAELVAEGYAIHSGRLQIKLIVDFGCWTKRSRISIHELTRNHAQSFLCQRNRARRREKLLPERGAATWLDRLFSLLEREKVITVKPQVTKRQNQAIQLVQEFRQYLSSEKGLAATTIEYYEIYAASFLRSIGRKKLSNMTAITAADIIEFVQQEASVTRTKRIKLLTTSLRAFLHFLSYRGWIKSDLGAVVPSVAHWAMSSIPKSLPKEQVVQVLQSCDRMKAVGRRDFAILMLLARLGLRAGEVASLTLDDIDWQSAAISIRGKGNRFCKLPIPEDVGEALFEYLHDGRPAAATSRHVFLRHRAPHLPFTRSQAVSSTVARAFRRVSIDSKRRGAHQFRHTFACEMLRQGASLPEIAEMLRHQTLQSTMIYAKVELSSLHDLALAWPGGDR